MKNVRLFSFLILGGLSISGYADDFFTPTNPATVDQARAIYASAQRFHSDDIAPVTQENGNWSAGYRPRAGANVTLDFINFEAGIQSEGYRVGFIYRSDLYISESHDMADFVRANRQQLNFDPGRTYSLDYHANGFTADGVRITKSFSNSFGAGWEFQWGGAASLLQGRSLAIQDVTGNSLSVTGGRGNNVTGGYNYNFNGTGDLGTMTNQIGALPGAPNPGNSSTSVGYSLDIGIGVAREDGLRFDWVVSDALGRMRWNNSSVLTGKVIFPAGYFINPPIQVNVTETLPVKNSLSVYVPTRIADVLMSDTVYHGINMPRIGLSKHFNSDWAASIDYESRFQTVGVGASYRWLYVNFRTDTLQLNRAHALAGSIGAKVDF
jgi:hypothetical protein